MSKSIQEITDIIVEFSEKRGWKNEDPNQLITSILIELSELAEHFQWKSKFKKLSEDEKIEVGYEFVDVIIYLLRFAHNAGIDIEKYFDEKLPKLAKKYPVGIKNEEWSKVHNSYRKSGKSKKYD